MRELAPILSAGGSFTLLSLLGLGTGIAVGRASGQPLWAFGGLMAGLLVAERRLRCSLRGELASGRFLIPADDPRGLEALVSQLLTDAARLAS